MILKCSSLIVVAVMTALSAAPAEAQCPTSSVQARVQRDHTQPWTQNLIVPVGTPFRVGGFYDGSGLLSPCVALQVSATGWSLSPSNGSYVTTPAGSFILQASYNSFVENAYITVTPCTSPSPATYRLGWPLPGNSANHAPWALISTSSLHVGDDYYAQDWQNGPGTTGGNVYAPMAGTVLFSGTTNSLPEYGEQIVIKSTQSPTIAVRVAHLAQRYVSTGLTVQAGQLIGTVGDTGLQPTKHLHIVLYKNINVKDNRSARNGEENLKIGSAPSGAIRTSDKSKSKYNTPFTLDAANCWNL